MNLHRMSALEIAQTMSAEDERVAHAVRMELPHIAEAIDLAAQALAQGGRIVYMGAGTSGRLGLLDAAECPPTFGVSANTVVGLIAGGSTAFQKAVEGAEDDAALGEKDLQKLSLSHHDVVVGLAASGRTPYVVGGLAYARSIGCATVAIACVQDSAIGRAADVAIEPATGAEVLTGSTRLKAGTAEKMVLNMISTGAMVRTGKVYQNLMVNVQQTNEKLQARAQRIVQEATDCTPERAREALRDAEGDVKAAIVMIALGLSVTQANEALRTTNGHVGNALARS